MKEREPERFPLQLLRVLELAAVAMRFKSVWSTTKEIRKAFERSSISSYCERTTLRDLRFLEALGCVESRKPERETAAGRVRRACLEWRWRPGANLLMEAAATAPASKRRTAEQ